MHGKSTISSFFIYVLISLHTRMSWYADQFDQTAQTQDKSFVLGILTQFDEMLNSLQASFSVQIQMIQISLPCFHFSSVASGGLLLAQKVTNANQRRSCKKLSIFLPSTSWTQSIELIRKSLPVVPIGLLDVASKFY